nr:iron chelate uptake ABC transporter family permease subunit [Alysiella crassa]
MKHKTFIALCFALLLWCVGVVAWLYSRQWGLGLADLFAAADTLAVGDLLFVHGTLPRLAMGVLAGGALSVAAVLLQQVMHNPLASDSTLAVSSGAQAALLVATIFAPSVLIWGAGAVAFVGAVSALLGVLWLSARRGLAPLVVVLSGLVMSLYLSAVTGALGLFYVEEARGLAMWGAGSLVQDSWHDVGVLAMVLVAVGIGIFLLIKPLNIMALSDEQAVALGIPVKWIRLAALTLAAVLAAYVVALVGMMGFVGLAASAAVRLGGFVYWRLVCWRRLRWVVCCWLG